MEVDGCCYLDGGGWVGFRGEDVGSLVEIGPKMGENRSYLDAHCHIAFQLKMETSRGVTESPQNQLGELGWRMKFPVKMVPFQGICQFSGENITSIF